MPDEIVILAGEDDPVLCNICRPTLSGLVVASERIGYQAAQRLQNLMDGNADDGGPQLIEPVETHTRHSTGALAIKDDFVNLQMYFSTHVVNPKGERNRDVLFVHFIFALNRRASNRTPPKASENRPNRP